MRQTSGMHERITALILIAVIGILLVIRPPVWAESKPDSADDTHELFEKSLSIVEIDKEIARIGEQKQALLSEMTDTEKQLLQQEEQILDKKEQAGDVLRAHYMGERDFLLTALLSVDSLSNLFRILDYIDIILSHDKHTLNSYMEQYRLIKDNYSSLESRQAELFAIEDSLKLQRERVIALEKGLEEELESRSDADRLRLLILELTTFWETAGITEVKQYFHALSKAMGELPAWIGDNKELLEIKGLQYTITVPEAKLNEFLREQNELFNHFAFQFNEGQIIAAGERDNMEIRITGHYTVENEPVNGILFHVDELKFNGFTLPDTTRRALEEEFDLAFYPSLIVSFIKANSVEVIEDALIIKLGLKL